MVTAVQFSCSVILVWKKVVFSMHTSNRLEVSLRNKPAHLSVFCFPDESSRLYAPQGTKLHPLFLSVMLLARSFSETLLPSCLIVLRKSRPLFWWGRFPFLGLLSSVQPAVYCVALL